jgi:predicted Ser/Thr protein kinase
MAGPEDEKDPRMKIPGGEERPATPQRDSFPTEGFAGPGPSQPSLTALHQRYDVLAELGRGGMGIVYKARDRETEEVVALKVLKPEIAARPDVIERFKAELRLARKITHKSVCRTHELLRFGEDVVIAMEYVEGESLRAFLDRYGSAPLRRGLEWAGEICVALGEAHAQSIVHRDLKPENIMIDRNGRAKVMDFGIARSLETDVGATGTVVGTPAYMSPEQAEGKHADTRSDIYALGLILYEMFTGKPAFEADTTVAMVHMQVKEPPPPPRSVEPYLPAFLARAIQKCLEKNPAKRFQSVKELETALGEKEVLEPQAAQLALPPHLLHGRRSDFVLILLGLLGLTSFVWLDPGINPESGLRVQMTNEMVLEKAKNEVTRNEWKPGPDSKQLVTIDDKPYNFLVDRFGYAAARKSVTGEFPPYSYEVQLGELDMSKAMIGAAWWEAEVTFDLDGSVRSLQLPVARLVPKGNGLPQTEALELARRSLQQTLGVDTGALEMESSTPVETEGRHGNSFRWMKRDPAGIVWHYQADIYDRPTLLKKSSTLPEDYTPPRTHLQFLPLIVIIGWSVLALVLFFARRLYSQVRAREIIAFAILALLASVAVVTIGANRTPIPESIYYLIDLPLFAAVITGWLVIITPTITYLAHRPWPYLADSFMALIHFQPASRATGVALVRGISCGLLITGCSTLFWRLGISAHLARPELWDYSQFIESPFPLIAILGMTLMGAVFDAYLAASVLSIARRWISLPLLLAVVGGVVVGLPHGYKVPPNWFLVSLPFAIGAAACWILLKFDLLTAVAAIFTYKLWDSYALIQTFQTLGNWQFWLPFAIWGAVLAWAVFAGFRPMWDRTGRRLAEMFD